MTRRQYLLKRIGLSIFAIYLVMSITFSFIVLTGNPTVELVRYEASHSAQAFHADNETERKQIVQSAVQEYKQKRNIDEPVVQRYAHWLQNIVTLDWGKSFTQNIPVTTVLGRAIPTTLAWVLPAMAIALLAGVGLGLYSALNPGTVIARILTGGSYIGFGIPNYWIANVAMILGITGLVQSIDASNLLKNVVLPAAILGTTLLAGQLRYTKATSRNYAHKEFVTLLRAKGGTNREVARHVLRNGVISIFSLFITDLAGIVVVNIFVLEQVLGIPGLGKIGLAAISDRDLPLILGISMTIAFTTIGGNLLQDLLALELDPRLDTD